MIRYQDIPLHGDMRVSKRQMPVLPSGFKAIPDYLGDKKDALRQYRGPCNTHVLEYEGEWSFHRDHADPRNDLLGHMLLDAPEIPAGISVGVAVALRSYGKGEDVIKSLAKGFGAGLVTWAIAKGISDGTKRR